MHGKVMIPSMIVCVMLVLPAAAFASEINEPEYAKMHPQNLQVEVSNTVCHLNATTGYLQNVLNINQTRFASLNQDVSKLNGDITSLQVFVSTNDTKGFKLFIQGQLKNDTRSTNLDVIHLLRSGDLTKDQEASLRSLHTQLQSDNKACMVDTKQQTKTLMNENQKDLLEKMQKRSENLLDQMQNRTHNMLAHMEFMMGKQFEHMKNMTDKRWTHFENMTDYRLGHLGNMTDKRFTHFENMTDYRLAHMGNMTDKRFMHIENMTDKRLGHMENMTDNRLAHMGDKIDDRFQHEQNYTHPVNPYPDRPY